MGDAVDVEVQVVELTLSDGRVGTFSGRVLVRESDTGLRVVDVRFFEPTRLPTGAKWELLGGVPPPGDTGVKDSGRWAEVPPSTACKHGKGDYDRCGTSNRRDYPHRTRRKR